MPYAVEGSSHLSCFSLSERLGHGAERRSDKQKPRQQRLAVGDKVKDSAVPPRLTRHRCRVHSSTANTVRLLTRALRPRLLVTFRLGPPGPILSGSVCRHHTIADSLSVRLPFSSRQRFVKLSLSYHRIFALSTDFDPLSQFFVLRAASTCPTRTRSYARTRMYALQYCRNPHAPHPHRPAARCDHRHTPSKVSHARQHILSRDPPATAGITSSVIIVNFVCAGSEARVAVHASAYHARPG